MSAKFKIINLLEMVTTLIKTSYMRENTIMAVSRDMEN